MSFTYLYKDYDDGLDTPTTVPNPNTFKAQLQKLFDENKGMSKIEVYNKFLYEKP